MNRRNFLSAFIAAPIVHEVEPVRRVYSFLWSNPLVCTVTSDELRRLYDSGVGFIVKLDTWGYQRVQMQPSYIGTLMLG